MEALLSTFEVGQIIIFVFMLAVAIKEVVELFSFFRDKFQHKYTQKRTRDEEKQNLEQIQQELSQLTVTVNKISEKIDVLQASDKDAIKSWVVMLYRKYKGNPTELDSMEMDLLERRFGHYTQEGGNSYVSELMEELRNTYKKKEETNVSN